MQLPREIVIGNRALNVIPEICSKLGFKDLAFIVTGPKTYKIAAKSVIDSLKDAGFKTDYTIVRNSTLESVNEVISKIMNFKPSVILGIGGGKDIDVAKSSSASLNIPFISVPTTASHDGISSPFASIKGLEKPYSINAQAPIAIIADIEIILSSPYRFIASGCGDILAKYTAVRDWKLANRIKNEYYGDYAANLALMSAKLILKNAQLISKKSEEGVRTIVEALISCGVAMSIAGSTRPCSGSEHLFTHALDLVAPNNALHGEKCGVGTIMCAYLHNANWRLVRKVLKKVQAPTTAKELNVNAEDIVKALSIAHKIRPERYTILGETGITYEAAEKLAKATYVI
ncbi:MAG: NAD(P)-dependent glycerol-1-phosphate dehydrogenase [Candidatus Bathyarchaeia archaeon]